MAEYNNSVEIALEESTSTGDTYNLTVFTTDADGSALNDVGVEISGPTSRSGNTGSRAAVNFSDIPPGDYDVTASKTGYETKTVSVTVDKS